MSFADKLKKFTNDAVEKGKGLAEQGKLSLENQKQLDAIKQIVKEYGIDALPEPLRDAALLRIANPEASLSDLAQLSYPPVSKSCLSYRLKKIISFVPKDKA